MSHACHSDAPRRPGIGPRQLPAWALSIGCGWYFNDARKFPGIAKNCAGCDHAAEARRARDLVRGQA